MTREFLQTLLPEGQTLPKEAVDAIMAENGRDIQKAKAAFADYDMLKTSLEEAQGRLQQQEAQENWKEKYDQAVLSHAAQLRKAEFDRHLELAVLETKGRSGKAITALLDIPALQESEDQPGAIRQALEELKQEHGYLFYAQTPPPYARNTGANSVSEGRAPASLAGALREKFERK